MNNKQFLRDERLKSFLEEIYNIITQYNILIVMVWISVVFFVIADATPDFCMYKTLRDDFVKSCPWGYEWLKSILQGSHIDYAALSAFILAVWAASLSLIGIFLGRAESKVYGIKVMDIFREKYSYTKLFGLLLTFVMELIVVMLALIYQWQMTLIISSMLQVLMLIYILLMVFIENSVSNIKNMIMVLAKEAIKREKKDSFVLDWTIEKVINNIDYKEEREIRYFYNILEKILKDCSNDLSVQKENIQQYAKYCINKFIKKCANRNISTEFISNLLLEAEDIYITKGIMEAVFENIYHEASPDIDDIIAKEFSNREEIIIWGIAYNGCHSMCYQQQYRLGVAKRLLQYLERPFDKKKLYEYWKIFIDKNKELVAHNNKLIEEINTEEIKPYIELVDWRLDRLWEIIE